MRADSVESMVMGGVAAAGIIGVVAALTVTATDKVNPRPHDALVADLIQHRTAPILDSDSNVGVVMCCDPETLKWMSDHVEPMPVGSPPWYLSMTSTCLLDCWRYDCCRPPGLSISGDNAACLWCGVVRDGYVRRAWFDRHRGATLWSYHPERQ